MAVVAMLSDALRNPELVQRAKLLVEMGDSLIVVSHGDLDAVMADMDAAGIDVPVYHGEEVTDYDILIGEVSGEGRSACV